MIPNEIYSLVGLARRAGKAVYGNDAVRHELLRRKVKLVIFAEDFSAGTRRRILLNNETIPHLTLGSKTDWGQLWRKEQVGVIAITDANFAAGILGKASAFEKAEELRKSKSDLRAKARARRAALPPEERAHASRLITQRLVELPVYQQASTIHTYVAWQDEVDNHGLIRSMVLEGRKVVIPKTVLERSELQHHALSDFESLAPGVFGILEPLLTSDPVPSSPPVHYDLILVPGIAFDRHGNRLGFGKGFYDRFLSQHRSIKIALAFSCQVVDEVPSDSHDQKIDVIVTEREVIPCS